MIVFPHAKINIGLHIIDKREDGFHNLDSIFYPIPLCDILEMVKSDSFSFTNTGIPVDGKPSNNLVLKAYELLKKDYQLPPVNIQLHKIIPLGAGLGGGSSDGAFALRLLNNLFDLKITKEKLMQYALNLGSDCPFFIEEGAKLVGGRGEKISPAQLDLSGYYIKIVNPGIHINTKEAFEGLVPKSPNLNTSKLNTVNFEHLIKEVVNDFEPAIIKKHPIIGDIKEKLLRESAVYVSMTGTGSSVYGIFKSEPKHSFEGLFEFIHVL